MKKYLFVCVTLFFLCNNYANHQTVVEVHSVQKQEKMPLFVGIIGTMPKLFIQVLQNDLNFSGQFAVTIRRFKNNPTQKIVKKLLKQGFGFALFVDESSDGQTINWRLYDTLDARMIAGKSYHKQQTFERSWAHHIADSIWPVLTGTSSSFSTKIAYCKNVFGNKTYIMMADYDGSNEQLVVTLPTISIAPRWNQDKKHPLLFYSEYTNTNLRLISIDMHGNRNIASNGDGTNMLPSFSFDGTLVVYCASHGNGYCQIYLYNGYTLTQLTNNRGQNFCPVFSDNNELIFFCSDFECATPQIYSLHIPTGVMHRLTQDGYNTSLSYCTYKNQLVYTRMVAGIMQIFLYDIETKQHRQITYDSMSKKECCWSPCGNYIIFSTDNGIQQRIALLNMITNEQKYITASTDFCSYPAWSPIYNDFPCIKR